MRAAESGLDSSGGVVDLEGCFYQEGVDDDDDWVLSELEQQRYDQSVEVEGHHERCVFEDDSCEYEEERLSC